MIVIDCETSGVNAEKNGILSIAAVEFEHPLNQFYGECYLREGAEVDTKALEVNGFTEAQINDRRKESEEELMKRFLAWVLTCQEWTLAGHNPGFDRDFVQAAVKRYSFIWPFGYRSIDLHSVCYVAHLQCAIPIPRAKNRTDINIDKALQFVGLPAEPKPHHALNGAKCAAEALSRLIFKKGLFDEFASYELPQYIQYS